MSAQDAIKPSRIKVMAYYGVSLPRSDKDYIPFIVDTDYIVSAYRVDGFLCLGLVAGGDVVVNADDERKIFDRLGYEV